MDFKLISDAIKNSSPEIRRLMFSSDLGQEVNGIAFENNLDEDRAIHLAEEIGYVILGLKPRFSFAESLKEAGVNENVVKKIAADTEAKIFIDLDKIKSETDDRNSPKRSPDPKEKNEKQTTQTNNIGQSFEEIILNQARAMQPAKEAGQDTSYDVQDTIKNIQREEPEQNKAENKTWQNPFAAPSAVNRPENYKSGEDPYREPIE